MWPPAKRENFITFQSLLTFDDDPPIYVTSFDKISLHIINVKNSCQVHFDTNCVNFSPTDVFL